PSHELLITALRMRFDDLALFRRQFRRLRKNARGNKAFTDIVQNRCPREQFELASSAESQTLAQDNAVTRDVRHMRKRVEVVPRQTIQIVRQYVISKKKRRKLLAQLL